jgi:propionyl-CoA carboxylase alpha chain
VTVATIRNLLIANRGEVVSRVARTARRMGIRTIGVYAESDANGIWLRDTDVSVALGDDATSTPYLNADAIIAAARRAGADAVHPGYGFLAESAEFAAVCEAAGLTWVGPPADVIRSMGLKIEAKETARAAGVPVLDSIDVGDDLAAALGAARELSAPLLVKPSAGGGGKGMIRVESHEQLEEALVVARREAISSFGNGALFIERCIDGGRHIEVQIVADAHGSVIHLGERDCSLQRRHQKILEETPAPGLNFEVRQRLLDRAVDLARAIGYQNVGTAEFLVFDDEIAFLELNTRLQVEHAVTEEVTGLDLVELQLRIAMGQELPVAQSDVAHSGCAVEVRLYAEDPRRNFIPSPGVVSRFDYQAIEGVRWEVGIGPGRAISSRYDPMIAKLIARGEDRGEALDRVALALRSLRIHGVATNRELLLSLLGRDELRTSPVTTDLLVRRPELLTADADPELTSYHTIAAALTLTLRASATRTAAPFAPVSWRNLRSAPVETRFRESDEELVVKAIPERDGSWLVSIGDADSAVAVVHSQSESDVDLELDGVRRRCDVTIVGPRVGVDSPDGHTELEVSSDDAESTAGGGAGDAVAPLPGIVVSILVGAGDEVQAGTPLIVLEAMKMEHEIVATGDGVVTRVAVQVGASVDYHQLLIAVGPPS